MHYRRLASLMLGAWLAGTILVMLVATQEFQTVEDIFRSPSPQAAQLIRKLGASDARLLLRHQASQSNRWLFPVWERTQLVLGALVILGLFLGADGKRYTILLCALMLITTAFLRWFLTPEMEKLGSGIDFVAANQASVARDRFQSMHTGYATAETIKVALGLVLAGGLLKRRRRGGVAVPE